ncbi:hypothetical protein L9F63_016861, partial [Diploptera punctata]
EVSRFMILFQSLLFKDIFLAYSYVTFLFFRRLQRFDKQPEYTEVNPEEDVLLTCKIFNKRGTCSWQKDNKFFSIPKNKTTLEDARRSLWRNAERDVLS